MGTFPVDGNYAIYQQYNQAPKSVSSITRSGSTATVTTVEDHGFNTFGPIAVDWINIEGADQTDYNGVPGTPFKSSHGAYKITVTGAKTFTYTVSGSPTTPATGTITATRDPRSYWGSAYNSFVNRRGSGTVLYYNSNWVYVGANTVAAGAAYQAITGQYWQGSSDEIYVRRARICVIKASSLTAGWGVGSQQQSVWIKNTYGPDGFEPNRDGSGATFVDIPEMTQTYTPANAGEQTIVFAIAQTQDTYNVTYPAAAPLTSCSYQLRDDTEGVNYASDFCNPITNKRNVNQTFCMAVKDDNVSSSTWKLQVREPNDTGFKVAARNCRVVIIGLQSKS
jgi:hypothetical protein